MKSSGPGKNGWSDQSRRNSPRTRNPSANLYSAVIVELLQQLIGPAEQPLVVETLVSNTDADRLVQLKARVDAKPFRECDSASVASSLVT